GPPPLGKLPPGVFERLIAPHLGAARAEVLVGPRVGADCAVVKLSAGRVMAITTDPLSIIPCLGHAASARLACHLLASDLWTSGLPPAYATVDLNLPPRTSDAELGAFWAAMSDEWARLEVAVVGGHTGRYPGGDGSIVGAATLIGIGDEGRYITPAMAAPGDRVIVTKGCAIEATAIAAHLIPVRFAAALETAGMTSPDATAALDRARASLSQVSVVADCRALLRVGVRDRGVSALHDATEGGVLGGLLELARASGNDLRVERARIPISAETRAACEAWGGLDPYWTLSEGALVAAVRPTHAAAALASLAEAGIAAAEVGEIMSGGGRLWLTDPDGMVRKLEAPEPDPYWAAYDRAVREGWR
ncbi:MAG TPA: AIR synthase-related protein, partial [Candidatus Eisenbacteria bacterium]|nr:AIR synthase-related protein [Candidatus Eisenbacteria bacterium]